MNENRLHDILDKTWELLKDHLPGQKGKREGQTRDNRQFINAVVWILRTWAPWRDLLPEYGDWKKNIAAFVVGEIKEYGGKLFNLFVRDPDFECLMIDASDIKVHPHAGGAVGGNQDMERTKGCSPQKSTLQ